jgi:uncharacterized protein (DUF2147 family)
MYRLSLATFSFLALAATAHATDGKAVYGKWLTESGSAVVEIKDCGDGTPCGTIIRLVNADETVLDTENPDPEMAKKPLVGAPMLWGFKPKSDKWSSGKIYNAENGKTYKSKLELQDDGTLKVKGCVGPICQGQIWTAVP